VDRSSAARFSFLLSTPIIIGAGILECWSAWQESYGISGGVVSATAATDYWILIVGTVTSAVTGFFCIRYFLRYLRANSLIPFVVYRLLLAAAILIMLGVRY
jgi:undecaprenyl-diphosphatase